MRKEKINPKKVWKKVFNDLKIGDRVRLVSTSPVLREWVVINPRVGVIKRKFMYQGKMIYDVRFRKSDNPTMTEFEDYLTLRKEELELIT